MKITSKKANAILSRYNELRDLAEQFIREIIDKSPGEIRITENGTIEAWENHSCHCHPEYWWEEKAIWSEFCEWLDNKKE